MVLQHEYRWHILIIFACVEQFHINIHGENFPFTHTESWSVALEFDFQHGCVSSPVSFSAQTIMSIYGIAVIV